MAKGRMVHKKIWDCNQFNEQQIIGRLLYIGLITIADDLGHFRADAKFIKRRFFYSDRIGPKKVGELLQSLQRVDLIRLFDYKDGTMGLHPKWDLYQKLRKDIATLDEFPDFKGYVPFPPDQHSDN